MYIGELAQATNLSIDTLRYYEKIGLIINVPRDTGGRRVYDQGFVIWVEFLKILKATGMPIRDMLTYANLRQKGPATNRDRCALLVSHEAYIKAKIAEQQTHLALVQDKIAAYNTAIEQERDIPISACISDQLQEKSHE